MSEHHLDTLQLAELAEGLLPEPEADLATTHLDGCPACQRTAADLTSVAAQLGSAPTALPTPPDVVARLDAALVAEQVRAAIPATSEADTDSGRVVEIGWFRRRAPRLLTAAAAIGAIGFVGYAIGSSVFGGGDDVSGAEMATADAPAYADDADAAERAVEESDEAQTGEAEELSGQPDDDADEPRDGAADDAAGGDMATLAPMEAEVLALLDAVDAGQETGLDPDCGSALADDVGLELIGAAPTDILEPGAVLVVVDLGFESDPVVEGWIVPACDSTADDALGEPVLVPAG